LRVFVLTSVNLFVCTNPFDDPYLYWYSLFGNTMMGWSPSIESEGLIFTLKWCGGNTHPRCGVWIYFELGPEFDSTRALIVFLPSFRHTSNAELLAEDICFHQFRQL
jgi:hypothetical protein